MTRFIDQGRFQYIHGNDIREDLRETRDSSAMTRRSHWKQFALFRKPTASLQLPDRSEHVMILDRGQCVSEPALWTLWEHCGELMAVSPGSCASLESKTFEELVMLYPVVLWLCVLYSRQFIIHMNKNFMTDLVEPPEIQKWE